MDWSLKNMVRFLREDAQFYIFLIIALFIPITKSYLPVLMFLWVLFSIVPARKISISDYRNILLIIFPLVFYLIHVVGLIYSDNTASGLFDLEVKLSALIIPFSILFMTKRVKMNLQLILRLFVIGNVIASIACLVHAYFDSMQMNEMGQRIYEFSIWPDQTEGYSFFRLIRIGYSKFSDVYLSYIHHPSYYSMYILFSIVIIIEWVREKKNVILNILIIIYFTAFLFLLGSRAAAITALVVFILYLLLYIFRTRKYFVGIGILLVGLVFSTIIISKTRLGHNIHETIEILKDKKDLDPKSDIRLWLWKSGLEIIENNMILGVGTGDINDALHKQYAEYNLQGAYDSNLNVHNQYLDIAVKFGLVGLIIFIGWMVYSIYYAYKKNQYLFLFFMVIVSINFLFESMLNTIAGVAFLAFWYSILYYNYSANKIISYE